ncbi:MAG: type II secretion system GspH family protein [Candidatus Kaiserbacteria bacterium]|nr:type II secretion system GspH family protein [Candidatus Kaiserbacteria bacterium]
MKKFRNRDFSQHHPPREDGAGFTLIELLVVIAIIGILSSIVLASLNTARQKSRDARRVSDIKQLQLALELYYDANGTYPTAANFYGNGAGSLVGAGYISVIPSDPSSATVCSTSGLVTEAGCYRYAALGTATACTNYHLGASLEVPGNSVFLSDSDAPSSDSVCTFGGSGGTNFGGAGAGNDTVKCETADNGVGCFDVKS